MLAVVPMHSSVAVEAILFVRFERNWRQEMQIQAFFLRIRLESHGSSCTDKGLGGINIALSVAGQTA